MRHPVKAAAAAAACAFLSCQVPWQAGERACADAARLDFPVDLADFAVHGSLRPFGAHGGTHPEGHPGIDFLLDGADTRGEIAVKASFSAEIVSITPETDFPGSSCIVLDSACVEVNLCHVRLDPSLKEGGSVARGRKLGTVGLIAEEGRYALHFGAYSGRDADLVCPADFLDPDSVRCRLGSAAGGKAPADCGYAPGTVTLMGRSEYAERFRRALSVQCADGSTQSFALPEENALCNPRLPPTDRARMEACLGSACAGVW
ncbi:MAG TPA: hypothetical protein VJ385_13790 [Fibrobacteria bacterium]|nr:hypothetical protein [Fibrobacteria bacterium]